MKTSQQSARAILKCRIPIRIWVKVATIWWIHQFRFTTRPIDWQVLTRRDCKNCSLVNTQGLANHRYRAARNSSQWTYLHTANFQLQKMEAGYNLTKHRPHSNLIMSWTRSKLLPRHLTKKKWAVHCSVARARISHLCSSKRIISSTQRFSSVANHTPRSPVSMRHRLMINNYEQASRWPSPPSNNACKQ